MAGHGVVSGPARQRRMIRGWSPRRLRHPQFLPILLRHRVAWKNLLYSEPL